VFLSSGFPSWKVSMPCLLLSSTIVVSCSDICSCLPVFVTLVSMGIWGLQTYGQDPVKAEKSLLIQYATITFINAFAAVLEARNIFSAFKSKAKDGAFPIASEGPHENFGHTIYDKLHEQVGFTIYVVFCVAGWFIWPLFIVQIQKQSTRTPCTILKMITRNRENISTSPTPTRVQNSDFRLQ